MKAKVEWKTGMQFAASTGSGHQILMDSSAEVGGSNSGPRPTELLLAGLGGCTGMDMASILRKMQQPFKSVDMEIEGTRAEDHPKRFTAIHLHYTVKGSGLNEERVARAAQLSVEKYCSVSHSLNADITYDVTVVEE